MPSQYKMNSSAKSGWVFSGSLGFYKIDQMLKEDGQTFFSRLSIEKIIYNKNEKSIGLEVGMQNGNQSRLGMTDAQNDDLNGTSVLTTLKPEVDILLTYHSIPQFLVVGKQIEGRSTEATLIFA